jgi:hypothetical protein
LGAIPLLNQLDNQDNHATKGVAGNFRSLFPTGCQGKVFLMKAGSGRTQKILFAIGLLLIFLTFALNEQIVKEIFSTYQGSVTVELKIGVFVLDVLFALVTLFILVHRKPKAKLFLDALVGVGFTVVLLVGIEFIFYHLNSRIQRQLEPVTFNFINGGQRRDVQFTGEHAQAFFQRDDWLGYTLVPDTRVVASRKEEDEVLYEVVYSIDEYRRRVTPIEYLEPDPHFILFFGGSYTFGEGVNDNETMPYYVSQLAPKYKSYNYGVGGYGPQHMLAKLQSEGITTEIDESRGILVYTFIGEHIGRAIGSMGIHNQRGDVMPYYFINADGELIRRGNFVSGRPLVALLYSIAGKSQTLKYFHIDFPLSTRTQDLETTARIFEESRNVYREKFDSDEFYILIYPGLGAPELIPYLETAGINYLDYSDLPYIHNDDFWLGEGHPSAKAHKIVAEKLVQDLGLLGEAKVRGDE